MNSTTTYIIQNCNDTLIVIVPSSLGENLSSLPSCHSFFNFCTLSQKINHRTNWCVAKLANTDIPYKEVRIRRHFGYHGDSKIRGKFGSL